MEEFVNFISDEVHGSSYGHKKKDVNLSVVTLFLTN